MEIVSIEQVPPDARSFVEAGTGTLNQDIARLRRRNPCWTLDRLGQDFGVTGERVRQILVAQRAPTAMRQRPCAQCHQQVNSESAFYKAGVKLCRPCYAAIAKQCHEAVWGTFICETCEKVFTRRVSSVANNLRGQGKGHVYCSRQCFGQWAGTHRGAGSPQAALRREARYAQARVELPLGYSLLMDRVRGKPQKESARWKAASVTAGVRLRLPSGLVAIPTTWNWH